MNLFHRFRISNALDSKEPLSAGLQSKISNSPELQDFSQSAVEVDRSLRNELQSDSPPWLHASIMNAIKTGARRAERKHYFPKLRRCAFGICVLAIAFGVWFSLNRLAPTQSVSMAGVTDALDFRVEIKDTIPDVQVSSLSDELERLNHDLDNATQTLLAALP